MHLAGVTHSFGYIDCVGTLVDVLTSKQHFHLRRKKDETMNASLKGVQCLYFFVYEAFRQKLLLPCEHLQLLEDM